MQRCRPERALLRLSRRALAALALLAASITHAVSPGDPLPALEVQRFDDQSPFADESLRGQVVYVDFWASWCPPCVKSLPALNRIYAEYRDQGFTVLAVNLDEQVSDAQRFLARYPVDYTVVVDPEGVTARQFQLPAMPTSYLVGRDGRVLWRHLGFKRNDEAKIRAQVEAALAAAQDAAGADDDGERPGRLPERGTVGAGQAREALHGAGG